MELLTQRLCIKIILQKHLSFSILLHHLLQSFPPIWRRRVGWSDYYYLHVLSDMVSSYLFLRKKKQPWQPWELGNGTPLLYIHTFTDFIRRLLYDQDSGRPFHNIHWAEIKTRNCANHKSDRSFLSPLSPSECCCCCCCCFYQLWFISYNSPGFQ